MSKIKVRHFAGSLIERVVLKLKSFLLIFCLFVCLFVCLFERHFSQSKHRLIPSTNKLLLLPILLLLTNFIASADVITYYIVCLSFPGPQAKFS